MRVTDEMVEVALAAYVRARGTYEREVPADRDDIRAALEAALSHAAGQDGEQCRAASGLDESEQRSLEQRAAAWDAVVATCLNIDRNALASYGPNGRESIVAFIRALSRGVPEDGRIPSDEAIARAFRDACAADLQHTGRRHKELQRIYDAAIAAQRKEG